MVVSRHRDHFFGALLADHVFVQLLFDLMRSRDVVDREDRFGTVFLLFLDLGLLPAPESASEQVSQVQEADIRSLSITAERIRALLILLLFYDFRLIGDVVFYSRIRAGAFRPPRDF